MPKNKTDNRTVEIKMDDKLDIQTDIIISGIKSKFLFTKRMSTERNNFFKYLMKSNLDMFLNSPDKILKCQFGNTMKNVILKLMIQRFLIMQLTDGDIEVIKFTKYLPYVLDLTSYRYEFEKSKEIIKGYTISKINKFNKLLYAMGLPESSLTHDNTIQFLKSL